MEVTTDVAVIGAGTVPAVTFKYVPFTSPVMAWARLTASMQ